MSWNRYAYTLGDPINGIDPMGKFTCFVWENDGTCTSGNVDPCTDNIAIDGFAFTPNPADCVGEGPPDEGSGTSATPCEISAASINNYIASTAIYGDPKLSKPLAGMGQSFIDAALKYDTNPAILVAIAFQESHWGYNQRNSNTNNAFGLLHADGSFLTFNSWQDGISSASKTVDSLYNGGNRSVSDLYSGLPGAYCTHNGCSDAIKGMEKRVRALGGDPNYLGFDCEMRDGALVKKE